MGALFDKLLDQQFDLNYDYNDEDRFEYTDQSSRLKKEIYTDARSTTTDYTYAPTIVTNSPNASANPSLKKETTTSPQITTPDETNINPIMQRPESRTDTTEETESSSDSSGFTLIALAGAVVAGLYFWTK